MNQVLESRPQGATSVVISRARLAHVVSRTSQVDGLVATCERLEMADQYLTRTVHLSRANHVDVLRRPARQPDRAAGRQLR